MSIYFLQYGDLVKIGYSSDLPRRIAAIMGAIPGEVVFLGHMPGDLEMEAHLHKRFHQHRFSGEWFKLVDEIASVITALADTNMPLKAERSRSGFGSRSEAKPIRQDRAVRLKAAANLRFPSENRTSAKIRLIAQDLGWGERRVKSVVFGEPYGLTPSEHEGIEDWISRQARSFAQDIAPEAYSEDDDQ